MASGPVELVQAKDAWFSQRVWSLSGNKVLADERRQPYPHNKPRPSHLPSSIRPGDCQPYQVLASDNSDCVRLWRSRIFERGGAGQQRGRHPGSGASEGIEFHRDGESELVTVGAGVVFRELVEAVKEHKGALPVGTGPGVGVVGYPVNGGLSGYFSRRLGLLGQRVVKLTMVTPAGDIRVLTPEDEPFVAMLGVGSALGIVVDETIRMEQASAVQGAEQRVVAFETRAQAVEFSRGALRFMRDHVFPNESVSVELVVTETKALVATVVFYDSFRRNTADFVKPVEDLAARLKLPVVAESH